MTNCEYLNLYDKAALVDLLMCYAPWSNCYTCEFAKYGFPYFLCGKEGEGEWATANWLASEHK